MIKHIVMFKLKENNPENLDLAVSTLGVWTEKLKPYG